MDLFFLMGYSLCVGVVVQSVMVHNRVKNLCVVKTVQGTTNVLDECVKQTGVIDSVCLGLFWAVLLGSGVLYALYIACCSLGSASKRGAVDRARLHGVPVVSDSTSIKAEYDDGASADGGASEHARVSPKPREYS